jgi:hypothetical protein
MLKSPQSICVHPCLSVVESLLIVAGCGIRRDKGLMRLITEANEENEDFVGSALRAPKRMEDGR